MFNALFVIVPIFIGIIFIASIVLLFSPKLRGKFLSHQIKSLKHMTDYSKEDLEAINKNLSEAMIDARSSILDNKKEKLKNIADTETDIREDSIRRTVKAFRDGLSGDGHETEFCKYCGELIDKDSIFCKACGKKLK